MPAYIIAEVDVTDAAGFEEYRKLVPPTIQNTAAATRGGATKTLEGGWAPKRLVVLEFPSAEQAQRWYDCEEYRAPKALRIKTTRSRLVLVEGVSGS